MAAKNIIDNVKAQYPLWKILVWRLFRCAVATAVAQTFALQVDWTDPKLAGRTLAISFISGLIMALGKGVRDELGTKPGIVGEVANKIVF